MILRGDITVQSMVAGGPVRIGNLQPGEIRIAEITDLAGMYQIVQRPQSLLDGCRVIGCMLLI